MPILLALLAAIAFFVWYNWGRDKAKAEMSTTMDSLFHRLFRRKPCQWIELGAAKGHLREYRCETCGVTAYSSTDKGPVECKKALKNMG